MVTSPQWQQLLKISQQRQLINDNTTVCSKLDFLLYTVKGHETWKCRWSSLVQFGVLMVLRINMLQKAFSKINNIAPPEKGDIILNPYLPTSIQQPLSSVPKVAVIERFDCTSNSAFQAKIVIKKYVALK